MSETSHPVHTHHRICPLCEACCGLEIKVQAKTASSASAGDEADVLSRGYICPKAIALKDLHEDPDRLRTPADQAQRQTRTRDLGRGLCRDREAPASR